MTVRVLPLEQLTEPGRPITYGVVKPGPEDPESGVLFIRGGDVAEGRINEDQLRTITPEVSAPYARTVLRGGELVVSLVGNPGQVAVVPSRLAGANLARQVGLVALKPEFHAPYIKYFLMSPAGQAELFQRTQGAVQQVINLAALKKVKIRLPPRPKQERIADTLSAYDDLIDNNRRRIALLEQSARLLYREWFVHLRYPGHEHAKVVDGVPEGWGRKLVSEIADINARSLQRGFHGEIEYIDIASVTTGSINETTSYLFSEAPGRARRIVRHGDLIWSCVRPNRASYAMIWNPAENLVASTGFCVLSPSAVPPAFLYFGLSTQDFIGYLTNNARGAAYPAVVAKDFETYQLLVPSAALLNEFQAYAEPIFEQMGVLKEQNSKLRQARDLLLPRLMRGDVTLMECLEET